MHYQEHIDQIFGKGSLWKHRTLRTIFDPYSSEYNSTSMEQKIEILKTIKTHELDLDEIIEEYKGYYIETGNPNVAKTVEEGLVKLLNYTLG